MHPSKAWPLIVVTPFGIPIDVRDAQKAKAEQQIVVTLLGISIDARDVHP